MNLTALLRRAAAPYPHINKILFLLGLFGAALFYGVGGEVLLIGDSKRSDQNGLRSIG